MLKKDEKEFSLEHISVLVVIFRTRLGHTTQIRYNLLHMSAFLYQKEILEIKAWMSLDVPMVDDNVNVQLLLHCKDPATDFAVSRSPYCVTPLTW